MNGNGLSALWIDMRLRKPPYALPRGVASACRLTVVRDLAELQQHLALVESDLVVFDFDYPDTGGLQALLATKQQHAAIPILMLTEQHYDNLLLWALRARVWDVLVKPVTPQRVLQRMEWIYSARSACTVNGMRGNVMPSPAIPMEARFAAASGKARRTDAVCDYVSDHLHEKLSVDALARRCDMTRYEFSRVFHSEHGVTFREYVLNLRLHRAAEMITHTDAPITEIAFCVGFRDMSHFASLFRRRSGCSPSRYRDRHRHPA